MDDDGDVIQEPLEELSPAIPRPAPLLTARHQSQYDSEGESSPARNSAMGLLAQTLPLCDAAELANLLEQRSQPHADAEDKVAELTEMSQQSNGEMQLPFIYSMNLEKKTRQEKKTKAPNYSNSKFWNSAHCDDQTSRVTSFRKPMMRGSKRARAANHLQTDVLRRATVRNATFERRKHDPGSAYPHQASPNQQTPQLTSLRNAKARSIENAGLESAEYQSDFDIRTHLTKTKEGMGLDALQLSNPNSARRKVVVPITTEFSRTPEVSGLRLVQAYQKDRNERRGPSLGTTIMSYKDHMKLADSFDLPAINCTPQHGGIVSHEFTPLNVDPRETTTDMLGSEDRLLQMKGEQLVHPAVKRLTETLMLQKSRHNRAHT